MESERDPDSEASSSVQPQSSLGDGNGDHTTAPTPRGPNCWLENLVIPDGRSIQPLLWTPPSIAEHEKKGGVPTAIVDIVHPLVAHLLRQKTFDAAKGALINPRDPFNCACVEAVQKAHAKRNSQVPDREFIVAVSRQVLWTKASRRYSVDTERYLVMRGQSLSADIAQQVSLICKKANTLRLPSFRLSFHRLKSIPRSELFSCPVLSRILNETYNANEVQLTSTKEELSDALGLRREDLYSRMEPLERYNAIIRKYRDDEEDLETASENDVIETAPCEVEEEDLVNVSSFISAQLLESIDLVKMSQKCDLFKKWRGKRLVDIEAGDDAEVDKLKRRAMRQLETANQIEAFLKGDPSTETSMPSVRVSLVSSDKALLQDILNTYTALLSTTDDSEKKLKTTLTKDSALLKTILAAEDRRKAAESADRWSINTVTRTVKRDDVTPLQIAMLWEERGNLMIKQYANDQALETRVHNIERDLAAYVRIGLLFGTFTVGELDEGESVAALLRKWKVRCDPFALQTAAKSEDKLLPATKDEICALTEKLMTAHRKAALSEAMEYPKCSNKKERFLMPNLELNVSKLTEAAVSRHIAALNRFVQDVNGPSSNGHTESAKIEKRKSTLSNLEGLRKELQLLKEMKANWKGRKAVLEKEKMRTMVSCPHYVSRGELCKEESTVFSEYQEHCKKNCKVSKKSNRLRSSIDSVRKEITDFLERKSSLGKLKTVCSAVAESGACVSNLRAILQGMSHADVSFIPLEDLLQKISQFATSSAVVPMWGYLFHRWMFVASASPQADDTSERASMLRVLAARSLALFIRGKEFFVDRTEASPDIRVFVEDLMTDSAVAEKAKNEDSIDQGVMSLPSEHAAKTELSIVEREGLIVLSQCASERDRLRAQAALQKTASTNVSLSHTDHEAIFRLLNHAFGNQKFNRKVGEMMKKEVFPFGINTTALSMMRTFSFKSRFLPMLQPLSEKLEKHWRAVCTDSENAKPLGKKDMMTLKEMGILRTLEKWGPKFRELCDFGLTEEVPVPAETSSSAPSRMNGKAHKRRSKARSSLKAEKEKAKTKTKGDKGQIVPQVMRDWENGMKILCRTMDDLQAYVNSCGNYKSGDILLAVWTKKSQVTIGTPAPRAFRVLMSFTKYEHTAKLYCNEDPAVGKIGEVSMDVSNRWDVAERRTHAVFQFGNNRFFLLVILLSFTQPRMSHMYREYHDSELGLDDVISADVFRIRVAPLLRNDQTRKAVADLLGENYEEKLQERYHKAEAKLHLQQQSVLGSITNPFDRVMSIGYASMFPWTRLTSKKLDFETMYKELFDPEANPVGDMQMTCSEFAIKTTVASLYFLSTQLCGELIEKEGTETSFQEGEMLFDVPFSSWEKPKTVQPERLREMMTNRKAIEEVAPPPLLARLINLK